MKEDEPKIEKINEEVLPTEEYKQDGFLQASETAITTIEKEYQEVSNIFDTLEKNAEDIQGEEGNELREEIERLKEEARWSAEWWTGQILAFTNAVVGEPVMFPPEQKNETEAKEETFEEIIARAKKELAENGITSDQKEVYKPINSILNRGIDPWNYFISDAVVSFLPNVIFGRVTNHSSNAREVKQAGEKMAQRLDKREDAWGMYLGLPQKKNTFEISEYQPENNNSTKYCYKLKNFFQEYFNPNKKHVFSDGEVTYSMSINDLVSRLTNAKEDTDVPVLVERDDTASVMGWYNWQMGKDEKGSFVAYTDVWDINVPIEREKGFFGKPFTTYDRLYYNPETFEPIMERNEE
jgi:hypothetical protein